MDGKAALTETAAYGSAVRHDGDAVAPDPALYDPPENNVVFTSLVTGDKDIVGLVAYSIYKQNKYDWLQAYGRIQGRMPNAEEAHSYLLGESTPRRLATYRHLAEAVLDGRGPAVPGAADGTAPTRPDRARFAGSPTRQDGGGGPSLKLSAPAIAGLAIALVALLILFWLLHGGAPTPPPGK